MIDEANITAITRPNEGEWVAKTQDYVTVYKAKLIEEKLELLRIVTNQLLEREHLRELQKQSFQY